MYAVSKMKKQSAPKKNNSKYLILASLTLLLVLSVFNLSFYLNLKPNVIYAKIDNTDKRIGFWNTFLEYHPDYFEGWIEVAKMEYKRGNLESANIALSNAKNLNPNSPEIIALENLLTSSN